MSYTPGEIPEPRADLALWAKQLTNALRKEFLSIGKIPPGASVTKIVGSGSISVATGPKVALSVIQPVSGAGIQNVVFTDLGTATYSPFGFLLTSGGEIELAVPQIPPLSDSRTSASCQMRTFSAGTLYTFIALV